MEEKRRNTGRSFGIGALVGVAVLALLTGALVGYQTGKVSGFQVPKPPSASLGPPQELQLGQTGTLSTGTEVTVYGWNDDVPEGWDEVEGTDLSSALVRFCAAPGGWSYRVKQLVFHFNLVTEDGDLVAPLVDVWRSTDELASYAVGTVSSDQCVTGTVVFSDPPAPIAAVRFIGVSRIDWDVSGIADGTVPAPTPSVEPGISYKSGTTVV